MINFACRTINLQDVVRCSFELTKTEYELLRFLLGKERMSVSEISRALELERSTVQKALQGLQLKELAQRTQTNLSQGGYKYLYEVQDPEDLKTLLLTTIKKWYHNVEEAVKTSI